VHGQLVSFTEARDRNDVELIVMNSLMENIQEQVEIEKQQGNKITRLDFTLENLPSEVEYEYASKAEDIDTFDTFVNADEVARLHAIVLTYKTAQVSSPHPRRSL
jgi:cytochrome c biogenesis factor